MDATNRRLLCTGGLLGLQYMATGTLFWQSPANGNSVIFVRAWKCAWTTFLTRAKSSLGRFRRA